VSLRAGRPAVAACRAAAAGVASAVVVVVTLRVDEAVDADLRR